MTSDRKMGIAILGCGLIGQKRAKALNGAQLVACADLVFPKAEALAKEFPGAVATKDWRSVLPHPEVDIVIVSATNDMLAEMTRAVELVAGRVEVEASGGINLENVRSVAETGVDFISVGALTHSPKALDISLELEPQTFKLF